VSTAWSS